MTDSFIELYNEEDEINKILQEIMRNIQRKLEVENHAPLPDFSFRKTATIPLKLKCYHYLEQAKNYALSKSPNLTCQILGRMYLVKDLFHRVNKNYRTVKVHQILPWLGKEGDAIADEVRSIQKMLIESGYDSKIYCENFDHSVSAKYYPEYLKESSPNSILIYHHAGPSRIPFFIKNLPDFKILIYHNITPPDFYVKFDTIKVKIQEKGRKQTRMLAPYIDVALGDSQYNTNELIDSGYKMCDVLPLLLDYHRYDTFDADIYTKYSDGNTNILFVGRIAPNKCYEDIIKVFYYYKKLDPSSRLFLPGNYIELDSYYQYLQEILSNLRINDVYFLGKITQEGLNAYYKSATFFLSMSEHEGFCIPLVESMYFGVPVVAYNSSAIPETLGKGGILINKKDHAGIAELLYIFQKNGVLMSFIRSKQKMELHKYEYSSVKNKLLSQIQNHFTNNN